MAEANPAATAPALSGVDLKAITASIVAEVTGLLKPITDRLAPLEAAAATAGKSAAAAVEGAADKVVGPTLEEIGKLIDSKFTAQQTQTNVAAARDAFAATKMKDVPAIYRNQLPASADPAALAAAEQTIRAQYQDDLKASGVTAANVSGDPPAGTQKVTDVVDKSKLSPFEKIQLGYKQPQYNAAFAPMAGMGNSDAAKAQASAAATTAAAK